MKPFILSQQELKRLNNDLKDLEEIEEDLQRAKIAQVPNIEHLEQACQTCRQRIIALKKAYAKDKA